MEDDKPNSAIVPHQAIIHIIAEIHKLKTTGEVDPNVVETRKMVTGFKEVGFSVTQDRLMAILNLLDSQCIDFAEGKPTEEI